MPTLILHGDDDQIVPIGASALMSAKIVKNATLKVHQLAASYLESALCFDHSLSLPLRIYNP